MLTITQCAGVQAEVREETKCVQDLPVFYKGKEMFIDSGSSILKEKSPAVSCQQPAVFRIGTHYYSQVFIGSKSNKVEDGRSQILYCLWKLPDDCPCQLS